MHHNDLKCGEIVDDFCYIPKSFCSMKDDFFLGVQCWLIVGLMFRIWAEMKRNGHNSTINRLHGP